MDIVSHGLWGSIAFGRKNKISFWRAFFFGIMPDLFSFGVFFVLILFGFADRPNFGHEPPDVSLVPGYITTLYDISHSFIVFLLFFGAYWLVFRKLLKESLAWPLHIIFDIFTHSYKFFPTPFLWPISNFKIDGWPWSRPIIFFPNVVILVLLYLYFYYLKRRYRENVGG